MDYKTRLQTNNIDLDSILNTINSLPEASGGGIDTSDATATPSDMAQGATAYVNGEKIEGILPVSDVWVEYENYDALNSVGLGTYDFFGTASKDTIVKKDSSVGVMVPRNTFGDASQANVLKGKTFTSQNGINIIGTHVCSSGGIDTSDATATSNDIAEGITAYVNGEKITGTLPIVPAGGMVSYDYDSYEKMSQWANYDFIACVSEDTIIKKDSKIYTTVPKEEFGTATKTKVLSGTTFTSSEGMNLTGTIPSQDAKTITPTKSTQTAIAAGTYAEGDVIVEAIPATYITTTDANATAADIAKDKTAYVNGVKVIGTHECTSGGISGGIDTSDATATAADIAKDKTAYVNGEKVTGTMEVCSYYVSNVEPSDSFGEDGDLCLVRVGE